VLPDDGPAQIWDTHGTPKRVATLRNDFGTMLGFAFSPDGKLLVTSDGDTVIRFYDTSNWHLLHEYRGLMLETFAVVFSTDGKHVLLGGADEHIVELNTDGTEKRRIEKDADIPFTILPFGTSGQALIHYFDGEGRAKDYRAVWNPETGKSAPLTFDKPVTSSRVIHGRLWLATTREKQLEIFEYP
jgi:WD40 repeat protein